MAVRTEKHVPGNGGVEPGGEGQTWESLEACIQDLYGTPAGVPGLGKAVAEGILEDHQVVLVRKVDEGMVVSTGGFDKGAKTVVLKKGE